MQFLFSLVALGLIIYGVISANLLWVFAGVAAVALLASGRLGRATAEDANRFLRVGKALIGPLWRQLLLAARGRVPRRVHVARDRAAGRLA